MAYTEEERKERHRISDKLYRDRSKVLKGRKRTHCSKGHPLDEENTHVSPSGVRRCRICRTKTLNKYKQHSITYLAQEKFRSREKNKVRKLFALTHYGPNGSLGCCFPECSVTDLDMLSLDHVNDDGASHRREMSAGNPIYRWVEETGFPEGFQTLCYNHQMKKEIQRRRKKAEELQ